MDMALLGFTLVIASLSYLVYQSPAHLWQSGWQRFSFLRQGRWPWQIGDDKDGKQHAVSQGQEEEKVEEKAGRTDSTPPKITTNEGDNAASNPTKETHYPVDKRKETLSEYSTSCTTTPPPERKTLEEKETPATPQVIISPKAPSPPPLLTASQQMPPPPRPKAPPIRRGPLSAPTSQTLRIPSTGPLPNRGPPARNTTSNLLAPTASTLPSASRPRQKVILAPGHSPLDWADLTRKTPNLAGVPHLQRVTPSLLAHNNGRKGKPAWSLFRGRVYNVTPYLPFHPGGEGELMRGAGKDAEKMFVEAHPWVNWENMLGGCLVGMMVEERDKLVGEVDGVSELEDMD